MLDDGRLTDSQGRTVNFKNTVVIMTSNLGSDYLLEGISADGSLSEDAREKTMALLRRSFKPEFLNRMDEIVLFRPLTREEIMRIVGLILEKTGGRMIQEGYGLVVTDAAKRFIAEEAYTPSYGARPVKRFVQREVETKVARMLMRGEVRDGGEVTVDAHGGRLVLGAK
jgi:ATP-dependent Clp protease ATP-binding subunit ClpB